MIDQDVVTEIEEGLRDFLQQILVGEIEINAESIVETILDGAFEKSKQDHEYRCVLLIMVVDYLKAKGCEEIALEQIIDREEVTNETIH